MFHNVLLTSLTPLRNTNEISHWQNRPFTTIWPEGEQPTKSTNNSKSAEVKRTIKKKNKRHRTAFSTDQIRVLEQTFNHLRYINAEIRKQLSSSLQISERSVKIWFQNRRMKEKRETSDSCDSSVDTPAAVSPRPVSVASSAQEVEMTPHLDDQITNRNDTYQFPDFHFCNYPQYRVPTMPMEPFANDLNSYPTYYYPTLEDYCARESFQNDTGHLNSSEVPWSPSNFDLNYFQ